MLFRLLTSLLPLLFSCQDQGQKRGTTRPAADTEETVGYVAQVEETSSAGKALTVNVEQTTLIIPEGATSEDAEVRLRILEEPPVREVLTELGDPKGDVVELTFYDDESGEIFGSNLFSEAYAMSQILEGVDEIADVKYLVISSPDTANEKIQLIAKEAITTDLALIFRSTSATVELLVTHAVIYAIETTSAAPASVITIENSAEIANTGGTTVSEDTAPHPPTNIFHGSSHDSLTSSPQLSWTASDSIEVVSYEVAIGSARGLADVKTWADVGLVTTIEVADLTLTAGETYFASLRAVSLDGEKSSIAKGDGWYVSLPASIDCSGLAGGTWIPVPGNTTPGLGGEVYTQGTKTDAEGNVLATADFCVMKYEAKLVSEKPMSQVDLAPWVSITRDEARAACASLGEPEEGFTLINNAMWQAIARNIETAQDAEGNYLNWSNGSNLDENYMNMGHSDKSPNAACEATLENIGSSSNCTVSDESAPFSQKRTHTLSNEEVIWDLAGNVMEWISDNNVQSQASQDGYISSNRINDRTKWGPEGDYSDISVLGKAGGLGWFSDGTIEDGGVVARGGPFTVQARVGVYSAHLSFSANVTNGYIGFRCAYRP